MVRGVSARHARSLVALGIGVATAWVLCRALLRWVVLQLGGVGPDPLLPEDD